MHEYIHIMYIHYILILTIIENRKFSLEDARDVNNGQRQWKKRTKLSSDFFAALIYTGEGNQAFYYPLCNAMCLQRSSV